MQIPEFVESEIDSLYKKLDTLVENIKKADEVDIPGVICGLRTASKRVEFAVQAVSNTAHRTMNYILKEFPDVTVEVKDTYHVKVNYRGYFIKFNTRVPRNMVHGYVRKFIRNVNEGTFVQR